MCNTNGNNYEIGGWSNCNHGKFNTMQIRVKTQTKDNALKCPKATGWNYVMQIEGDPTMQDMPNNANEVTNGFEREHANYIGNEKLNAPQSESVWIYAMPTTGRRPIAAGSCTWSCG
jgi:hypothetical protein